MSGTHELNLAPRVAAETAGKNWLYHPLRYSAANGLSMTVSTMVDTSDPTHHVIVWQHNGTGYEEVCRLMTTEQADLAYWCYDKLHHQIKSGLPREWRP